MVVWRQWRQGTGDRVRWSVRETGDGGLSWGNPLKCKLVLEKILRELGVELR